MIAGSGVAAALLPLAAKADDYVYDTTTTTADSAAAGGILAVFAGIWLFVVVVALALFIFWIFMLVDAIKRQNWKDDNQKTMWLVILIVGLVVGLSGLAAIVYYFAVKRSLDKGTAPVAQPAAPVTEDKK